MGGGVLGGEGGGVVCRMCVELVCHMLMGGVAALGGGILGLWWW